MKAKHHNLIIWNVNLFFFNAFKISPLRASNYSTRSEDDAFTGIGKMKRVSIEDTLKTCLKPLVDSNIETKKQLTALRAELRRFRESMSDAGILSFRDVVLVIVVIFVQLLLQWWWKR